MPLPNDPVAPTFATMQWVEERIKKFQMQLGPMKRGGKRWPRRGGGGSGASTQLAIVTVEAAPSTYTGDESGTFKICPPETPGKCVLISESLSVCTRGVPGLAMPEIEGDNPLTDYELLLRNTYDEVPLQVGKLVTVTRLSGNIPAGPYTTDIDVWGSYHNHEDYRRAKATWNKSANQIEYHEENSDTIKWGGGECA